MPPADYLKRIVGNEITKQELSRLQHLLPAVIWDEHIIPELKRREIERLQN